MGKITHAPDYGKKTYQPDPKVKLAAKEKGPRSKRARASSAAKR